ncbi:MAG TPA: type II TA system antitoxin MqsA family protein [Ruminiclostridium sp.]
MKKIKSEKKLCLICMEEHEVDTVEVINDEIYKGEEVSFNATYEYCSDGDEYLETEEMIKANSLAMKDSYRNKVGMLTSGEIIDIRVKYVVSQKDFSEILDWGGATITRYENNQVQDRAHDDVLRKIDSDPKWFLEMLKRAEERISEKAFHKYHHEASEQFKKKRNQYLVDSIKAIYADYEDESETGRVELNLNKVIEMINYLAAMVSSLHKVKLMKMLWYSDMLHYKRNSKAISGLAYSALPKGAVPEGYDQIVLLNGVSFDTVWYGENIAYKFKPTPGFEIKELTQHEIKTLDEIILKLGHLNTDQIVEKMHDEEAYKCTNSNCIIPFSFAEKLTID